MATKNQNNNNNYLSAKDLRQAQSRSERGNALRPLTLGFINRQRNRLHQLIQLGLQDDHEDTSTSVNGQNGHQL